jgi:hypothetical protein
MTGRQILELVGKIPPEHWMLNQKLHKGHVKPIALDEIVDFTAQGVERFMTLPKDQTEGRSALRREFMLPEEDAQALETDGLNWEAIIDGNNRWIIIRQLILPAGLAPNEVSVAIQISIGYPAAMLDMAYFYPAVVRIDGRPIPCTEAIVQIEGVPWQRWSRHYTQTNPWKPGEYNVATHLLLVRDWLANELQRSNSNERTVHFSTHG